MNIFTDINLFNDYDYPVVTMGTFDGVHIGHQRILQKVKETAKSIKGGKSIIITFHPHPRLVLHKDDNNINFINTREEKIELFQKFGIDHLIIIPFTKEFSKITSSEFITKYLVEKIQAKKLIIGYDHHFGNRRQGNFEKMVELGNNYGFEVEEIPAQDIDNIAVSSTKIRNALNSGDIITANSYLGYNYTIFGKVVKGNKIGQILGFPTANIDVEDKYKLIPRKGVYAVKVEWKGKAFNGMMNIGVRPTLNLKYQTIELNIFTFDKNIYNDYVNVILVDHIRDEHKFEDMNALKAQLYKDRDNALKILTRTIHKL